METVSSNKNPRIRNLMLLEQKSAERRKQGLFVVEGLREVERCRTVGYRLETLFVCREILGGEGCRSVDAMRDEGTQMLEVTRDVYDHIAYRGGTEGVVATVRMVGHDLSLLEEKISNLDHAPLIVVLESVEKPGNMGAILRSADAAGADAVVVCDALTDLYNPNLIRSSLGAFFSVTSVACSSQECIALLKRHGIRILTAQLQDSELYYDTDMTCPTAIVMGTEATGLTDQWRKAADAHIRIPMLGLMDSLNVSVSAAVLMYEAVRQRQA